ncbi:ATP12 family chaperone protein [Chelativorans sp. M5D2P16]|uniref:ATP12 family chaperone protein n=1 Tax=Chelativorans sp. M5D2P16 TaxID=3095678 RepID=UPI002ACACA4E|nr:ATP12 family protein [Chelativorans sp. M5D2P16]MDZ5697605.1 ATP12 family protein [Chelativorans sp. M5D2P16]
MRDILNDLDEHRHLSDPDPMRRAQKQMRKPLPKRFYGEVDMAGEGTAHRILLDGRAVRTPAGAELVLPTAAAASLVRAEYDAQGDHIDPMSMPVTRLANTAIDGVANDVQAVAEDILRYASSDLLCYRAEGPERLVALQAEAWDPVLDWAEQTLGARFVLAEGVMHVEQPRATIAAVGGHLRPRREPLRIAAMHVMTSLTGSALLALAVEARALDVGTAWNAAHVDEDWNISQWGEDAEATARRAARERDMRGAAALVEALDHD